MTSRFLILTALVLTGCPTPQPQPDCSVRCAGLTPPQSICVDGHTARDFALRLDACDEACVFTELDQSCQGACVAGRCVTDIVPVDAGQPADAGEANDAGATSDAGASDAGVDPDGGTNACMNVTCAMPPASTCVDANTLRIFDARGVCSSGQCNYGSREEACTGGCANGACQNNPCQGVTCTAPPAAVCTDPSTLKSYAPSGTCANGGCRYAETLTTCQFGCANGRCTNDPCAGVSCTQPPAPFCSSATALRTFGTQGVCSNGSCLYSPTDTTCRFGCQNGRCVNDPCQGITCNTPPASACLNATTLRTFGSAGVCSSGSCLYTPTDSTCQFGCANGACTGNPCQGVTCNQPPAATCVNPSTLRTFTTAGTCAGGACSYASQDTACQFGCLAGRCTNNPCQGVTCNMPPAATCVNATTLRTFSTAGTCANGACGYASQDTACAFGCLSGACVGNPCQGVSCNQPPASTCVTASTLRTFSTAGTCANGACSYSSQDTTCAFGCANGACTGNPCQGVTCNTPPASTCLNATTLRTFSTAGTCSGGACSYSSQDTTCVFGCASGACVNNPCQGVTCNMPPANTCLNATTLRSFNATGVCSGGACSYSSQDSTCQFGCASGACVNNPCQGVTCNMPPAATCVNPTTLRTFSPSGTCSGGACSYTASESTCAFGCANGACTNNPCQGVTCNSPPASTCVSATTLRTFATAGTCAGGGCTYAATDTTCQFGCASGACTNDPCAGVTCTMPPARTCLNATTLRSFSATGTCAGGACSYTPSDMACAFGCSNGACVNDPCQGVTCTTPPATACVGSNLRTYSASGTCANGTCGYTFTDTPCPGGCANAMCQAPTCGGSSCNTPPAPTCLNANRLRTAFPLGTCSNNTCGYTEYEVLCSTGCLNGACISGSWTVEFMPQTNPPVLLNSHVIFDATGEPIQVGCEQDSSFGNSNGTVRIRRRTLSGWLEETIDTGMGAYCRARVALDENGEPMVAWFDSVNQDLRFAKRAGGTWSPKELIANQGAVGQGADLVQGPGGQPWVSYVGETAIMFATRAANGTWTSEPAIPTASFPQQTALRLVGSTPWILADADTIEVASKPSGTWVVDRFSEATSSLSGISFKPDSFTVTGGVPRAMVTDGASWVWRSRVGGQLYSEPLIEEPTAVRTDGPFAAFTLRTSGSTSTPTIRVRQNDAWPDTLTSVPYGNQIFGVASYTGANGRHVLIDRSGRRLSSPNVCVPLCTGRVCGDDGCGGSCGSCASGFCAVGGTCAPLRSRLISGLAPNRAGLAIGSSSTMHLIEVQGSYGARSRTSSGGVFGPSSVVTNTSLSSAVYPLAVSMVADQPAFFGYVTPSNAVAPIVRSSAGTWSSGPTTMANINYRYDAAGTAYAIRCTSANVLLSTLASGATAWTTEANLFSFGVSGVTCLDVTVNAQGQVFVLGRESTTIPAKLYSNRPGFTTQSLGAIPVSSAAKLAVDGSGNVHVLASPTLWIWRAATNTVESDATPTDLSWGATVILQPDRNDLMTFAYTKSANRNLVLARRTGPGVFVFEELPSSNGLTALTTGYSPEVFGLVYDTANAPNLIYVDKGAWRHVTR